MAEIEKYIDALNLETGRLCLDFANTAEWHASEQPMEELNSYTDLVSWAQRVGVLTERDAQRLAQDAARRPDDAVAVLERAIALREAIYRIFSAVAGGRPVEATDLVILNTMLSEALGWLQIVPTTGRFTWRWAGDEEALERMLWPVARSAADLLTSEQLNRVGECADDRGCGWLFLDLSRNRSRRWCDMKDCGNRAKVRRHYYKQQRSASKPST